LGLSDWVRQDLIAMAAKRTTWEHLQRIDPTPQEQCVYQIGF